MRVGVDYLAAVTHPPGVGRYVRELVRALVRLEERPALALFELGGGARVMEGEPLGLRGARDVRRLRAPLPRRAVDWLGRAGLGADRLLGGVDLFHRIFPDRPRISRAPETIAVAELPRPATAADAAWRAACRRAAATIVFCADYRARVAERYDLDPARVHALPVGCEHWARARPAAPDPGPRPRFLVLGALREERRPLTVLRAFEALRAGGVDAELVLVGRPGSAAAAFRAALAASPARDAVRWDAAPREAEMPETVAAVDVLVHLAEEEGSPVTPLEAFSLGLDVVAARLPAFVEALGEEALYVELARADEDPGILGQALATAALRRDDALAAERRRAVARVFTWRENARRTARIWQDVRRVPPPPPT